MALLPFKSKNKLEPVITYPETEKYYYTQQRRILPETPSYTSLEAIRRINGLAAAIISVNAARLASAELKLAVPKPSGNYKALFKTSYKSQIGMEFVDVDDPEHPVLDLLNEPNQLETLHAFIYRIAWKMQGFGQCIVFRDQRFGRTQLIDLDPNQYEIMLGPDKYSYNKPPIFTNGLTAVRLFGKEGRKGTHPLWGNAQQSLGGTMYNVIWPEEYEMFKLEDPTRSFYGKGWIEYMWRDLIYAGEKESADVARLFNKFGAEIMVKFPLETGEDVIQEAMNEFENRSRGSANQGNFIGYRSDGTTQFDVVKLAEYTADLPDSLVKKIFYELRGNLADYNSGQGAGGDYVTARNSHADKLVDLASPLEHGLTKLKRDEFPELDKGAKIYLGNIKKEDAAQANKKYLDLYKVQAIDKYELRLAMGEPVDEEMRDVYYQPPAKPGIQDEESAAADTPSEADVKTGAEKQLEEET